MTKFRPLLVLLAVIVLVVSAAGCGIVSDQTKHEVKMKVEAKVGKPSKKRSRKSKPRDIRSSKR
jgi:hypothetical protein